MSLLNVSFGVSVVSSSLSEVDTMSSVVMVFAGLFGCSLFQDSLLFSFSCVMVARTVSNRTFVSMDWMLTMAAMMNGGSRIQFDMGVMIFEFEGPIDARRDD